jgi:hypothetical protein
MHTTPSLDERMDAHMRRLRRLSGEMAYAFHGENWRDV